MTMFDFNEARSEALDRLASVVDEINELEATPPNTLLPELLPIFCLHLFHLTILRDTVRNHLDDLEQAHDDELAARRDRDALNRELSSVR
jgi:hypothetical protein